MMNTKRSARRKVVPGVDQLEARQLLSSTDSILDVATPPPSHGAPMLARSTDAIPQVATPPSHGTIGGAGLISRIKSAAGMADRVTFVIDEKGRIAHVIDKPNVANHAEEVLALI